MMANVGINQTNIYLARYLGDKVGNDNDIAVTSVLLPDIVDVFDDTCAPKLKVSSNVIGRVLFYQRGCCSPEFHSGYGAV